MSRRGEPAGEGDTAGEVSLSIDETNKLRASLGLAPLRAEAAPLKGPSEVELQRKADAEEAAKTEELAERVKATRERRRQQEALAATRTLGEADAEVDDVMSWVSKSRRVTQERGTKAEAERAERAATAARRRAAAGSDSEDEGGGAEGAALAGMRVKHRAEELGEGESMILTLEDQPLLDEAGQLREDDDDAALENVQAREDKQRAKAFRDSKKTATPLWEEDGVQRGLLHKYDEEEEEALRLDGSGAVAASAASAEQRQGDIRARLAAAAAASAAAAAAPPGLAPSAADFYTAEEVAAAQKPRKKKERRLKKRALTAEELAELEAGAAARGGADLGSRAEREGRAGAAAAGLAAADAGRRARFEAALTKANYASLALRDEAGGAGDGEEGEEDDDLYRSLNKARQLAQRSERPAGAAGGQQRMAEEVVRRREGGGGGGGGAAAAALGAGALTFTDVAEFARTIAVKTEAGPAATARQGEEGDVAAAAAEVAAPVAMEEATDFSGIEAMEEDGGAGAGAAGAATAPLAAPAAPPPARAPSAAGVWGSWAPAGEGEGGEGGAAAEEAAPPPPKRQLRARRKWQDDEGGGGGGGAEPDEPSGGLATEKAIGAGLAGALAFLKDRGELGRPVEWAGRTNDSRDAYFTAAMGGYKDVYTGGRTEDQVALGVEVALTRRDEYGRVLTPKEAFRQLCHRFHGIAPSKDTREKRAKQVTKELSQRKAATGGEGGLTAGARAAAEQGAVPYVALSGTVRPGQSRDAAGGTATVERAVPPSGAATPMLGGGQTPLVGRAKVEAMMGLGGKRPAGGGGASMPPPPPKVPRRK